MAVTEIDKPHRPDVNLTVTIIFNWLNNILFFIHFFIFFLFESASDVMNVHTTTVRGHGPTKRKSAFLPHKFFNHILI